MKADVFIPTLLIPIKTMDEKNLQAKYYSSPFEYI